MCGSPFPVSWPGAERLVNVSSYQLVKGLEHALPLLGLRVLHIGINDLEGAGERQAEATDDERQARLGLVARRTVKWRIDGQLFQDRCQLDLVVHLTEGVNALLQPFGDG